MVDRLGQTSLEHAGLKSSVQKLVDVQLKDVVQLLLGLGEQTQTGQAAKQGLTFEETLGVLLGQSEQDTSDGTDASEHVVHAPDLTLVGQTVFTDKLQLSVQALLLEGASRDIVGLAVVVVVFTHSGVACC